jgi:hypothetical protein
VSAIPSVWAFSQADYDNDGDLDVAAPRGGVDGRRRVRPSLLRNDGEGRFTDVAVAAGLAAPTSTGPPRWRRGPTSTATAGSTCSSAARTWRP